MKCAVMSSLISAIMLMSSCLAQTISDKIPKYENAIPSEAIQVASGYGWRVYLEETEETDYCRIKICRLFLENAKTGDRYLFLETKGDKQVGTEINIKARNMLAYGQNVSGYKKKASYEYGYLEAVSEVFVLSPTKILVQGVPDARNYYAYIIDLENYTAVHIDAYSGFVRIVNYYGDPLLEFETYIYNRNGRQEVNVLFDIQGKKVRKRIK